MQFQIFIKFSNFVLSWKAQPKLKETPLSIFTEHESTRTWGDELCNDLLYTILLRRQHTKNSGDGLQWETKKIKVSTKN